MYTPTQLLLKMYGLFYDNKQTCTYIQTKSNVPSIKFFYNSQKCKIGLE